MGIEYVPANPNIVILPMASRSGNVDSQQFTQNGYSGIRLFLEIASGDDLIVPILRFKNPINGEMIEVSNGGTTGGGAPFGAPASKIFDIYPNVAPVVNAKIAESTSRKLANIFDVHVVGLFGSLTYEIRAELLK
jgi:hypothetical protein